MIALEKLSQDFERRYGGKPRWLSLAPGRINLLGEHVDYLGGRVLPAAIDRGVSIAAAPGGPGLVVHAADFAESHEFTQAGLEGAKPAGWRAYLWGALREVAKLGVAWQGGSWLVAGDLPRGAGLSSSAALEVATANLLLAMAGRTLESRELARLARRVENLHVGTQCGIMDQFASIHGRAGHFMILDCASLEVEHVAAALHGADWILLNSMVKHELGDEYNSIRAELEQAERKIAKGPLVRLAPEEVDRARDRLTPSEYLRAAYAAGEAARTAHFIAALRRGDATAAGKLLVATHEGLSRNLRVSTPEIDGLIEIAAKTPGWHGGRMMGGGFGGCTLNLVVSALRDEFLAGVKAGFQQRFGIATEDYPVRLADGASARRL